MNNQHGYNNAEIYKLVVLPLFLALECEQFFITGSLALDFHGFTVPTAHDVDIVVINPSDLAKRKLERYVSKNPTYDKNETGSIGRDGVLKEMNIVAAYQFKWLGTIPVDVFTYEKPVPGLLSQTSDGILIYPIYKIIDAKLQLGRDKDYTQLKALGKQFIQDIPKAKWNEMCCPVKKQPTYNDVPYDVSYDDLSF